MSTTTAISFHPFEKLFPQERLPPIPEKLKAWHEEKVAILPAHVPMVPDLKLPKQIKITPAKVIREKWDQAASALMPRLALPSIFLGVVVALVGVSACVTIVLGIHLPGMDIILKNVPASLAFSLSLVRGGIHTINSGVLAARKHNRLRQETSYAYQKFRILDAIDSLNETQAKAYSEEVLRLDTRLAKSLSIVPPCQGKFYANTTSSVPYSTAGKVVRDMDAILRGAPTLAKPTVKPSVREAPEGTIDTARVVKKNPNGVPKGFLNGIYEYFYKKQVSLGIFDIAVGQFMLVAAIVGLVFISCPNLVPSGLEIFANDPYLSLPFAFILLGHWINCTRTGWRMLSFDKREAKRAKLEEDLQVINLGIEKCRVEAYFDWIKTQLAAFSDMQPKPIDPAMDAKIKEMGVALDIAFDEYRKEVNAYLSHSSENVLDSAPKGLIAPHLHRLGKNVVPALATPSILIGLVVLFMGVACLGFVTGILPQISELLMKNTSLSIIFAATLLVVGFNGIYRGASMSDFNDKNSLKGGSVAKRKELISDLQSDDPQKRKARIKHFSTAKTPLPSPGIVSSSKKGVLPTVVNVDQTEDAKNRARHRVQKLGPHLQDYQKKLMDRKGWYGFWLKRTEKPYFWGSQLVLGSFLLVVSVAGLLMVAGVTPPSFLDFIAKEPSASATFFFSLLAVGVDAINNFYRIMKYKDRKIADMDELVFLEMCHEKLFPKATVPLVATSSLA